MEEYLVPRLEHLAFTASFKDILSNIVLCQDHRPEDKQLETVSAFSSRIKTSPLFASQNLINFVRNHLDHHLVGVMNDKTRAKYVEKFNDSLLELPDNMMIDPSVFLDCVLDSTFKELETHATFPGSEPSSKLIPTIVKHSSLLQKLKIDFSLIKKGLGARKVTPLITSLSPLHHLTSLELYQLDKSHRSILKFIGNSCPLLSNLSISGFHVSPKDILSIILGEFSEPLFTEKGAKKVWAKLDSLEILQAPPEVMTPICFTLRHLKLGESDWDKKSDSCWSAVAFALRHLPFLEKMDGHSTSFGVESLHGNWGEKCHVHPSVAIDSLLDLFGIPHHRVPRILRKKMEALISGEAQKKIAKEFELACKKLYDNRPSTSPQFIIGKSLKNRLKSGTLALTGLDFVPISSLMMLAVIPRLCPHLKEAVFRESLVFSPRKERMLEGELPPALLFELLKEWPKLESITLVKMPLMYVQVILKAFAPSLKNVTFISCKNICFIYLIPCRKLESLRILKSSSLGEITQPEPGLLSLSSLFPQLKSFESNVCLDPWTSVVKGKSNKLTHIVLNCCHTGKKGSIYSNWIWPKVEVLEIRRSVGLTMSMLPKIVPQLSKLKELSLPGKMEENDPKLAAKMMEDLGNRLLPVRLSFTKGRSGKPCSLLADHDEGSTDSDDSDDDYEHICGNCNHSKSAVKRVRWCKIFLWILFFFLVYYMFFM